ncbi:flavin reductase family protein [Clostridium bowmanii]|uniref:flavin reductase family protein n=1 Tax=Clostridium bowmanii TaxID=132925 RepID=UPI001C0D4269|nr:flavin reductase family protein [Clostridium bowmanii]MBU3190690.1 flavin reductase family protein [Clostridium bowmanii]MCA1072586.1 flavin reductase family protein [Clostridium bowmanii]
MTKTIFKGSAMLNPVPVVLITSKNKDGKINVFTVAWIGTACTKPPMITVAIRPERLSYEYIKESGNFVVNLPNSKMVKQVDYCGVRSGKQIDKIKEMNFTMESSKDITSPLISECLISLECVVKSITPLGTHDLFLAEIVNTHVDNTLIDYNGKIHFESADLITYSHGEYFSVNSKPLGKFGYSVQKKSNKDLKKNSKPKHKNKA